MDARALDALSRREVTTGHSLAETLSTTIEQAIADQIIAAGERLGTKEDLRQRFGVAAGTLNEAVRLLQIKGIVEVRPGPGGGVFVSMPSAQVRLSHLILGFHGGGPAMADCLAVRDALEPLVAAQAALHRSPDDVTELRELLAQMAESRRVPDEYFQWNWQLHRRIAEISQNVVLRSIYLTLLDVIGGELSEVRPDAIFSQGAGGDITVHRAIVNAIERGDQKAARRHAVRHPSTEPTSDDRRSSRP
ncbi:MAG: FadR/GntR family transcriptional regulator [Nocardioidaceae bacterium]